MYIRKQHYEDLIYIISLGCRRSDSLKSYVGNSVNSTLLPVMAKNYQRSGLPPSVPQMKAHDQSDPCPETSMVVFYCLFDAFRGCYREQNLFSQLREW